MVTRSELFQLVWSFPKTRVGERLGVSVTRLLKHAGSTIFQHQRRDIGRWISQPERRHQHQPFATAVQVCPTKSLGNPHREIHKLLAANEQRREKAQTRHYVEWDETLFDTPFQKRRLRLMDGVFRVLAAEGYRPSIGDKEAHSLGSEINDQYISFSINDKNAPAERNQYLTRFTVSGEMRIEVHYHDGKNSAVFAG
jgi:hypothetical protein